MSPGISPIRGLLIAERTIAGSGGQTILLPEGLTSVGRGPGCDIVLDAGEESISRRHAEFRLADDISSVEDLSSLNGTFVNGARLASSERRLLNRAARIHFGKAAYRYIGLGSEDRHGSEAAVIRHFRDISSLDIVTIIENALALFRAVAEVEESYLISTRRHWAWGDAFLHDGATSVAMLDANPTLSVSRRSIEESLAGDRKVIKIVEDAQPFDPNNSLCVYRLKRIWIRPLHGLNGEVVAAVYLQSRGAGQAFAPETEALLDAVAAQLEVSIHNAALHKELTDANLHLEEKVRERTRELEESHERLVAQDRLAALGRLVAGIAHELNNPAGAIASLAETQGRLLAKVARIRDSVPNDAGGQHVRLLLERVATAAGHASPDTETRRRVEAEQFNLLRSVGVQGIERWARFVAKVGDPQLLEGIDLRAAAAAHGALLEAAEDLHTFVRASGTISAAASNIARIVSGLKQYAHLDQSEFVCQDIHRGIELTLEIMKPQFGPNVKLLTRFATLAPLQHRPGELAQVWTNLVDNALRAMGDEGELRIETIDGGDEVLVKIADTGGGIPPEIQPRIFELDFTTRGPGAGLGLGLPICRTIIERGHGGSISYGPVPGGTEFTVRLPKIPRAPMVTR